MNILADYRLRHLINNVAIHMITLEWILLYCFWKYHGINFGFNAVIFTYQLHGWNSIWDIFRI